MLKRLLALTSSNKLLHYADILNYSIRMYEHYDGLPYIVYSCNQTRMETLEYDNREEAGSDFVLLCNVIRSTLRCEGKL